MVHLAAKVGLGVDLDDMDDYVRTNDLGTAIVLRAAASAGVRRLVYASSMVVYGEGAYECPPGRDRWCRHHVPRKICPPAVSIHAARPAGTIWSPDWFRSRQRFDPRNTYAATKVHGEQLASCWARETNASVAALRFHNVYGRGLPVDTPYAGVAALFSVPADARRAAPGV